MRLLPKAWPFSTNRTQSKSKIQNLKLQSWMLICHTKRRNLNRKTPLSTCTKELISLSSWKLVFARSSYSQKKRYQTFINSPCSNDSDLTRTSMYLIRQSPFQLRHVTSLQTMTVISWKTLRTSTRKTVDHSVLSLKEFKAPNSLQSTQNWR